MDDILSLRKLITNVECFEGAISSWRMANWQCKRGLSLLPPPISEARVTARPLALAKITRPMNGHTPLGLYRLTGVDAVTVDVKQVHGSQVSIKDRLLFFGPPQQSMAAV